MSDVRDSKFSHESVISLFDQMWERAHSMSISLAQANQSTEVQADRDICTQHIWCPQRTDYTIPVSYVQVTVG